MQCFNCSADINGKSFCPNCGTKVEQEQLNSKYSIQSNEKSVEKSKRMQWIVGSLLTVIIMGVSAYFATYQFIYHPDKQIEIIRQSIVEEDAATFSEYARLKGAKLDEKQANQFIEGVIDADLDTEISDYLERTKRSIGAESRDLPIRLVRGNKQYGVFQTYVVELIPQTMYVSSNFEGITVALPSPYGKERLVTEDDTVIIQDAFPGQVEVAVSYDGQYGQDKALDTFNSLAYSDLEEPFMVTFQGLSVELDQTYSDSILYVNGEDSGKTIGEWKTYGPVPKQGVTLSTEIDTGWGLISSNEVLAKPNMKPIQFKPIVDRTTINFAYEMVNTHAQQWVSFIYSEDLDQLTLVTDPEYLARQQKTYETMKKLDQEWYGSLDGVEIINQATKIIEWEGEPAIETEAIVSIYSRFTTAGVDDEPERLAKSRFRYVIANEDGEYHLVKATYIE